MGARSKTAGPKPGPPSFEFSWYRGFVCATIDAGLTLMHHARVVASAFSPSETMSSLYESDFYTWSMRQAERIRSGDIDPLELQNIAEEIESLGREQSNKLQSAYRLIAMQLLKLKYQSTMATKSWRRTMLGQRFNIKTIIDNNPGLKPRQPELFAKSYADARKEASIETG